MIFLAVVNTFGAALALAVIAWVALRLLPVNAATRYWTWWAVLVAVIALPLWPERAAEIVVPVSELPVVDVAPVQVQPGTNWLESVALIWAVFAVFRLSKIAWGYVRLRRIVRAARPVHCTRFDALRVGAGIHRPTELLISTEVASPMMIGFLRPSVVMPEGWMERLESAELEHVLLHEMAHVARWDDWCNLAARLIGAVAGLHPVAAFALRRIAKERELACDDWVVASTGEARRYAASLAKVFEMSRTQPELLATGITGSQLGDRVEQILAQGRQFAKGASVMTVATMMIALAGLTAIGSQSPVLVAFAQEVLPAPPVAPAPPKPPAPARPPAPRAAVAPRAPRVEAGARAAAVEGTPDFLREELLVTERDIQEQSQMIKVLEQQLAQQRADLDKRRAELVARKAQTQGRQGQVRQQIERLQLELRALQEQLRREEQQQ